jgi:hypothetical protein
MPAPESPEVRRRAVELARRRDMPVAEIARDLGISESCPRRWMDRGYLMFLMANGYQPSEVEQLVLGAPSPYLLLNRIMTSPRRPVSGKMAENGLRGRGAGRIRSIPAGSLPHIRPLARLWRMVSSGGWIPVRYGAATSRPVRDATSHQGQTLPPV